MFENKFFVAYLFDTTLVIKKNIIGYILTGSLQSGTVNLTGWGEKIEVVASQSKNHFSSSWRMKRFVLPDRINDNLISMEE